MRSSISIEEMVSAVGDDLERAESDYRDTVDEIEKKAVVCAETVDLALENQKMPPSMETLTQLKSLMGLAEISLYNEQGIITVSSDQNKIQTAAYAHTDIPEQMAENPDSQWYVFPGEIDTVERPSEFYVFLRSDDADCFGIKIAFDPAGCGFKSREERIADVLRESSVDSRTIIMAVDERTGHPTAVARSTGEDAVIADYETDQQKKELVEAIAAGDKRYVQINGNRYLAVLSEQNGIAVLGFRSVEYFFNDLWRNAGVSMLFIIALAAGIILSWHQIMNTYVFDDLIAINQQIRNLLTGDKDIAIETNAQTEGTAGPCREYSGAEERLSLQNTAHEHTVKYNWEQHCCF